MAGIFGNNVPGKSLPNTTAYRDPTGDWNRLMRWPRAAMSAGQGVLGGLRAAADAASNFDPSRVPPAHTAPQPGGGAAALTPFNPFRPGFGDTAAANLNQWGGFYPPAQQVAPAPQQNADPATSAGSGGGTFMPSFGRWPQPTLHDFGMGMGAGIMGGVAGAASGFGPSLQAAVGQIGPLMAQNAGLNDWRTLQNANFDLARNNQILDTLGLYNQRNNAMMGYGVQRMGDIDQAALANQGQWMDYGLGQDRMGLDWRTHSDRMAMKDRLVDMLGGAGGGLGGGQLPQLSLPPMGNLPDATPGQVYAGQGFQEPTRTPDFSAYPSAARAGLGDQYSDALRADTRRALGQLDLSGTGMEADFLRRAQLARMGGLQGTRGLAMQRYGNLLDDRLARMGTLAGVFQGIG